MKLFSSISEVERRASDAKMRGAHFFRPRPSAFTLVEIAISLAIIGIALVAIIGVLPRGLDVQRENRERTVINQDATIFMEAIRNGARGADDLTNYVYQVEVGLDTIHPIRYAPFTNGADIIGFLTTPNSTNHANVRSISGPAVEKPPQDNAIIRGDASNPAGDTFAYRLICENVPVAVYTPPLWQAALTYNPGDYVSYILSGQTTWWQANAPTMAGDAPNASTAWTRIPYPQKLTDNLHELRLTFLWPILPNGQLPSRPFRQTFRTLIAGAIARASSDEEPKLYFFQSQSFTNKP
jgi:prepilin-type N-terminal cleavage/methylation domain-containing protein